jgi:triacylglycerol lipase
LLIVLGALLTSPLRAPRDVAGLVAEVRAPSEYVRLRRTAVFRGEDVADGDGLPVLLLPGFLTSESSMVVMGRWLHRTGHRPYRFGRRPNVDCSELSVSRLERRVEQISRANDGRRIALIGHSRGGQFARVLGLRRPDLVETVITIGMPPLDPAGVSMVAALPALVTATLGSVGVPGLWGAACFFGGCCADFREQLQAPLPDAVAHVAIHSPQDGIVDFARVSEAHAERVTVRATHVGMIVNADVYSAIASALRHSTLAYSRAS